MQLLHLMADGCFHSGQALGEELGISRAAVWKQLRRWQQRGLSFDVIPGKGYRWRNPVEWWDERALRQYIRPEINKLIGQIQIEQRVDSTNNLALDVLQSCHQSGVVCIAEEQTAGRGRRGRQWLAPLGAGFYGSIGWIFDDGVAALQGLSLAVGLAVAQALDGEIGAPVGLKWPNDLMLGGAKLGGILIEMHLDGEGRCLVVVGVGVNMMLPPGVEQQVGRKIADLSGCATKGAIQRNLIGARIIESVVALLSDYGVGAFAGMREAWCRRDVLSNMPVEVHGGSGLESVGIARGVDVHGSLIVETPAGMKYINSGEVSLRGV